MAVEVTPITNSKMEQLLGCYRSEERIARVRFGRRGCTLAKRYEKVATVIKNFPVREDDVWVVTPPKCGTTWTQEMVWLILNNCDFETAKKVSLLARSPFLELSSVMPEELKVGHLKDFDTIKIASNLTSPRCIKSHLQKDLLPDELWAKKPKIIFVAREPKDVAISYLHHEKLMMQYSGTKEFFLECFFEDLIGFAPFWEQVLDFWFLKDEPNILFNTYEEMKKDLPAVIRRTANFLGRPLQDEQVAALAHHLDFKQMKNNNAVNFEDMLGSLRLKGSLTDDQVFIRKGEVGEGARELPGDMAKKYDERTRRTFDGVPGGCPWQI